jgi:hypothetical protein
MVNDESRNSNNGYHNDNENPSSTLEQLFIVQAQLLQAVKQIMAQMQDVNHLMQSVELRPSSRKRKSVAQNDAGKAQKVNAIKR